MSRRVLLAGAVLALVLFDAATERSAKASGLRDQDARQHMACADVKSLPLPDVKITDAAAVAAATTGAIRAPHCRVSGVIGTEIRFLVLLPDTWNGKFMMGGGGGYVGTVQNQASATVNAGFATAGTDTGHQGGLTEAAWATDNPERLVNFGYLAVHRTSEVAKAIVRGYYGSSSTRSYFSGCSNGGRQAMIEAQRFPDDFDGIIAGAPALDFVGIAAQFIKDIQAAFPGEGTTTMFPPAVLKSIESQMLEKCDKADGVKDGLIEDPRQCKVDPGKLDGLTDAQKAALKKIYSETPVPAAKDAAPRGGTAIYPAQPIGGEGETAGWPSWITGGGQSTPQGPSLRYAFGTQFFKFFVFNDPSWDYHKYDVTNVRKDARLAATVLNATNPDLSAFKAKGRKIIMWHGWSDPALTALGSIRYYDEVKGRDPNAPDFFRLFLMPGVLHCAGGPGPDNADWTAAITDWVEQGKAPDRIVARKAGGDGAATRTRPLCPYPQHAAYSGSGSIDDAASFACTASSR